MAPSSATCSVVDGEEQLVEVGEALVEVARVEPGLLQTARTVVADVALGAEQVEGGVEQQACGARPGAPRRARPAQRLRLSGVGVTGVG